MLLNILLLSVVIGLIGLMLGLMSRWAGEHIGKDVVSRLRAAETIIEERRLPDEWLAARRAGIDAARKRGDTATADRLGRQAQGDVLRKMDEILQFFLKSNVTDTPDTKRHILAILRARRDYYAQSGWPSLFEPIPPDTGELARPTPR